MSVKKHYFVSYTGFNEYAMRQFGNMGCYMDKHISGMDALLDIHAEIKKKEPQLLPETIEILYWKRFES